MLSRSSAVIVSVTSLVMGIVLGVFLARGGPVVSAQVAGGASRDGITQKARPGQPQEGLQPENGGRRRQRDADDAIYDTLARQYEQFEQINRTFELVAKAVSPTVVHIVAEKVAQPEFEESRRSRRLKRRARA